VTATKVRFPTQAELGTGAGNVRFTCVLDCAWELRVLGAGTGGPRAHGLVMEAMKGKLDGTSLGVPTPDGSITDFVGVLKREVTVDEVNAAYKAAAESGPLAKVLEYSDAPLVS